ncbi:hypothetical protein DFH94DRAFT_849111, partial [Russula ochroleuca]
MNSVSCRPPANIVSNPISYPGTFLQVPQRPPTLEEARTSSLPLDIIAHTLTAHVNPEDIRTYLAGLRPLIQHVLIRDNDRGPGTLNLESLTAGIHDEGSPVTRPSYSMRRTRVPSPALSKSILPGFEAWWLPASRISNEDVNPADVDTTLNWHQECMTTNYPSDQSHQCAPVYMRFSSSVPSTLPGTSNTPIVVQNQERSVFQDRPPQFEERAKGNARASS